MHSQPSPSAPAAPASSARPTGLTHPALVVARHRARWIVLPDGAAEPIAARPSGRLLHGSTPDALPVVGDRVDLDVPDSPGALARIVGVHPRRGALRRQAPDGSRRAQLLVANVDVAFIVISAALPPSPRRLERWLTLAWEGGATPVVLLSKSDECDDVDAALAATHAAAPGVDVAALSARTGEGLGQLARWLLPGRVAVLLGASGVGKSTLANRLLGRDALRTTAVRDDGAGRHTTTHRELFVLPGGAMLVDTPGLREIGVGAGDETADALATTFADVARLAEECRFADCAHEREPGCAVRAAVADGRLAADRLESWRAMRREEAWQARRDDPAALARTRAAAKSAERTVRLKQRLDGAG